MKVPFDWVVWIDWVVTDVFVYLAYFLDADYLLLYFRDEFVKCGGKVVVPWDSVVVCPIRFFIMQVYLVCLSRPFVPLQGILFECFVFELFGVLYDVLCVIVGDCLPVSLYKWSSFSACVLAVSVVQ